MRGPSSEWPVPAPDQPLRYRVPPLPLTTPHEPGASRPALLRSPVPSTFADLGVPAPIVSLLAEQGITTAFPIQALTLPDALAGRDLCGKAPTGSGKTIAFGIPMIASVGQAEPHRPKGLVLVPTRELASQVRDELALLAGPRGGFIEAFYGGNAFRKQLNA